jgi:hypothetical protein
LSIRLKAGTCFVKCCRGPVAMLSRVQAWIEATRPLPLINVDRNARPFTDRADMHVAVIDMPGDLVWIVGAAAGEDGHRP